MLRQNPVPRSLRSAAKAEAAIVESNPTPDVSMKWVRTYRQLLASANESEGSPLRRIENRPEYLNLSATTRN